MKRIIVTTVIVLGMGAQVRATLHLTAGPWDPLEPDKMTVYASNDADGAYGCWLEIPDPSLAAFDGDPAFTPSGNPNGDSWVKAWPEYGQWYEVMVASLNPDNPIVAGDHIVVDLIFLRRCPWGEIALNLYASDGVTLLDSVPCIPEPATAVLLGCGVLWLRRRNAWSRMMSVVSGQ